MLSLKSFFVVMSCGLLTGCSYFGHLADYERDVTNEPLGKKIVGKWYKTTVVTRAYQAGTPKLYVRPYIQKDYITDENGITHEVPAPYRYLVKEGTPFQVIGLAVMSSHIRKASVYDPVTSFKAKFYPCDLEPFVAEADYLFSYPPSLLEPDLKYIVAIDNDDECFQ